MNDALENACISSNFIRVFRSSIRQSVADDLDAFGCARLENLLTPDECGEIASQYADEAAFRSRVVMARHGFGKGEYKYFRYPLPTLVARLRTQLYPTLANIANRWNDAMKDDVRYPKTARGIPAAYVTRPVRTSRRPAPAVWRRGLQLPASGSLWGARFSDPGSHLVIRAGTRILRGGEFVLTEQRPRMQSRARSCRSVAEMLSHFPFTTAQCGNPRHLSREHAARREPPSFRPTSHPRYHFSRREIESSGEDANKSSPNPRPVRRCIGGCEIQGKLGCRRISPAEFRAGR